MPENREAAGLCITIFLDPVGNQGKQGILKVYGHNHRLDHLVIYMHIVHLLKNTRFMTVLPGAGNTVDSLISSHKLTGG